MLFNIVGTIASGKTTFLKSFPELKIFEEPVPEWKPFFDALNADFGFTTILALQRKIYEYYHSVLLHYRENPNSNVVMERCHYENIYCFVLPIAIGALTGKPELDDPFMKEIMDLVKLFVKEYKEIRSLTLVNTFYLPVNTPEELFTRKNKRNQANDCYLTLEFFGIHTETYRNFVNIFALGKEAGDYHCGNTNHNIYYLKFFEFVNAKDK